jgi:hypothetical protein
MNKIIYCAQTSPLYPLKGRIAVNNGLTNLFVNAPLRGLGVNNTTQYHVLTT